MVCKFGNVVSLGRGKIKNAAAGFPRASSCKDV
jgi:hypothetical protein